jgi:hypothetical protein
MPAMNHEKESTTSTWRVDPERPRDTRPAATYDVIDDEGLPVAWPLANLTFEAATAVVEARRNATQQLTEWNIMRDDGMLITRSNTYKPAILTKLILMQIEGRVDVRLVQRPAAGQWADDDA